MVNDSRLLKVTTVIPSRTRAHIFALALSGLSAISVISRAQPAVPSVTVLAAQAASSPRTNGFSVNAQNREEVRDFFNAVFESGRGLAPNWTGNMQNCDPGTTSVEYQDAVLTRINFFRAMAGVPADVMFNPAFSAKAARAAAIVSANAVVTHAPAESLVCYTPEGREAAESSNLALGTAGIDSIEAYMLDAGNNFRVGHRRWLLYPQTREMGNADIDPPDGSTTRRANANWIFDSNFGTARPRTRDGFVAWPPPGFVPHKVVYPRWSFSFPRANFTNATVAVSTNGVQLPVHIENVAIGFGEETIVFVPGQIAPDARRIHDKPTADITYVVNIGNVVIGGASTNFSYTVTVFDAENSVATQPALTGPGQPQIGRTNRFRLPATPHARAYEFRAGTLEPYRTIVEADGSLSNIESSISALYPLVQSSIRVSPPNAFHLAHTTPPRPQTFTLKSVLVPSTRSELRFQSRIGAASTGQVARAQISLDHGSSWRTVYEQFGSGGAGELSFSQRAVSLNAFAGRAILLRFEYGFPFSSFNYAPGTQDQVGWYIDDIQVTFADEFVVAQTTTNEVPEFDFVPGEARTHLLDGRPLLFGAFGGEWTRGTQVAARPATVNPPIMEITTIRSSGAALEVEFTAENTSSVFQIEAAEEPTGPWQLVPQSEFQRVNSGESYVYRLPNAGDAPRFFRVLSD
jgi:hypothetical protein